MTGGARPDDVAEVLDSASFEGAVPDVSVVVSTYGRAAFLGELLEALRSQSLDHASFEVVIVDDASVDGTWAALGEAAGTTSLRLRVLRRVVNGGQGAGRNTGVRWSRAPVVAFTDDDCVPAPQWLEALTAPLRASHGEPPAVVAQGPTHAWAADAPSAGPWARTVWVTRPTWLFETCNIAYRRRDLEEAGGFPPRHEAPTGDAGRVVGEDAILGWRVIEGGAHLAFAPGALVHHRHLPATYLQWLAEQRGRAVFAGLLRRSPLGQSVLWAPGFLAPRTAAFDLALLSGLAAAVRRRPRYALGIVPWIWLALPEAAGRRGRHPLVRLSQLALGDLVAWTAMARASVRHRRAVL
ncbi:MAG TPA: glycosyltransferase family A protein [Acidimicrobiales bacterium]|nr:glycosyltransferase family A protein [Acidimicrobiales bacterium]